MLDHVSVFLLMAITLLLMAGIGMGAYGVYCLGRHYWTAGEVDRYGRAVLAWWRKRRAARALCGETLILELGRLAARPAITASEFHGTTRLTSTPKDAA